MKNLLIEGYDAAALPQVSARLLTVFPDARFFALYGAMGVGKTTLVKSCCSHLGVADNVCSPTFAIVNEYTGRDGEPVYHFDCYRLKRIEEAFDLGAGEYFDSGCYCFVEWPELVEPLLPDSYVRVDMEEKDGLRSLKAELMNENVKDHV